MNPHSFTLTPLLFNGGQNPLVNYLKENKLTMLPGTRWVQSKYPLYLLGESNIPDDPVAISHELNTRIFKVTGDVAPKAMEIEWCLVESNIFGRDNVTAPGYYVVGNLQSKDKIEFLSTTKVLIIAIFTSIAFFEFNTEDNMATPCSVNAKGIYLVPP